MKKLLYRDAMKTGKFLRVFKRRSYTNDFRCLNLGMKGKSLRFLKQFGIMLPLIVSTFVLTGCTTTTTTTTTTGTGTVTVTETGATTSTINQPSADFVCADLYKEIDNDIINANYCKVDADCDVLILGGIYVEFGCYHFINKNVDKQQFYDKMQVYNKKCSKVVDRCVPSPTPTCVANKCVYIKK